jgi:hypothetical protein
MAAVRAALAYFAIVFAAGFVLGTIRTLVLAPRLGELAAVMVEIPFMLLVAWLVCRWLVRRFALAPGAAGRLIMGGLAFLLLMAAELLLSLAFGRGPAEFLARFAEPAGALGLASQVVFGLLPLVVARGDTAR